VGRHCPEMSKRPHCRISGDGNRPLRLHSTVARVSPFRVAVSLVSRRPRMRWLR
jgi:hypothetical protein